MVSHRRSAQSGPVTLTGVTLLSAALATAAAALPLTPAVAEPVGGHAAAVARVTELYARAERATEKFNGATERTDRLRRELAVLQDRTARAQERVNRMRARIGSVAAAQYRSGGIAPTIRLLLSARPDTFLEQAAVLDRADSAHARQLHALTAARRVLDQQRGQAAGTLAELTAQRAAVARHKKEVLRKLAAARRALESLPAAARNALDRAGRGEGRDGLPAGPAGAGASSARAATAVRAVRAALGAPYAWGSTGPSSFDCSGLTQWAYRQAGVSLPRTSQAQRNAGRHVPLSQARPGDLVIYRADASHVGLYVGDGQVVHAPYPGARVRHDPVGMMPVSAVTRP